MRWTELTLIPVALAIAASKRARSAASTVTVIPLRILETRTLASPRESSNGLNRQIVSTSTADQRGHRHRRTACREEQEPSHCRRPREPGCPHRGPHAAAADTAQPAE